MTMKNHNCSLCGETHGLFPIEIPPDEGEGESFTKFVCGKCWDVIAQIAFLKFQPYLEKLEKKIKELEDKNDTSKPLG